MKTTRSYLIFLVFLALCGAGYFVYSFSGGLKTTQNSIITTDLNTYMKPPPTKVGPISMDAGALLLAALERVWLTKYFGAPAEIFHMPADRPLCEALPGAHPKQDAKIGVFIWWHRCLPIKLDWTSNREDKSGVGTIRMLDFDKTNEVLEEAFEIIRTNSLGVYRIDEHKIDAIKKIIKENSEFYSSDVPLHILETYSNLERRYILDVAQNEISVATNEPEDIRQYFSHRGRKYALTIEYDSKEFVKNGNIIEYSLVAPAGFFGMEKDYKNGKTP